MKIRQIISVGSILLFVLCVPCLAGITSTSLAVSRALDAYESGQTQARDQMTEPVVKFPTAPQARTSTVSHSELSSTGRKRHETELGFEMYSYEYEETVEGDHFMDLEGKFYGVFIAHTFSPNNLSPVWGNLADLMFKLEGQIATADLDYNGGAGGFPLQTTGRPDLVGEIRGLMGKDFMLGRTRVTPYSGFGLRWLEDDGSSESGTLPSGDQWIGYKRQSFYGYLPVGVNADIFLPDQWTLGLNLEYDFLLGGRQRSYLPVAILYDGDVYEYSVVKNKQRHGYGMRASLRLAKQINRYGVFVEPFVRFWDIEDSELARFDGPPGYEFVGYGMEPSNTTREIGFKTGIIF